GAERPRTRGRATAYTITADSNSRRKTAPPGPTSSNSLVANAPPHCTDTIAASTSSVGGTRADTGRPYAESRLFRPHRWHAGPMRSCRPAALTAAGALLAVVAAACGGGSGTDPQELVDKARVTLDATPSLHFSLTSDNVPDSGTVLTGGDGDVERPNSFQGT